MSSSMAPSIAPSTSFRTTQIEDIPKENKDRLIEAIGIDIGRPAFESSALEIEPIITECVSAWGNVKKWAKPEGIPFDRIFSIMRATIYKQPKGVALVIGPANYPILCSIGPLVGAIAAGCSCIVKMSEFTPNLSGLLEELWPKYMNLNLTRIVNGADSVTTALLQFQWDHIFFTGSSAMGKVVASAAAQHLSPVTLEMGGQCPVFFDTEIDLHTTTHRLLWGKTINAGQSRTAPNHVFVLAENQDRLIEALKDTYVKFYPKSTPESNSMSHIIGESEFVRLKNLINDTEGELVCGGDVNDAEKFIEPTIVKDVRLDDPLMQSEIFGPILPIVPVNDWKEAIDFTNSRDHPLSAYVFTQSAVFREKTETMSGAIDINEVCIHSVVPGLPFGGVGASGYGAHTGKFSFDTFTHNRSSIRNPKWTDILHGWRYPPYNAEKLKASATMNSYIPVPKPPAPGAGAIGNGQSQS
ncbi:hypothetical protein FRB96_005267 [Tulasnella sp. 330]|nr:hypothetical protein FRB96_005267 [Tulasnella sp. 330]